MTHAVHSPNEFTNANFATSNNLHSLYVTLGLDEQEAGYSIVAQATDSLGERTLVTPTLWQVKTPKNLDCAFKEINTSMLDRRIDSYSSLLVLDPTTKEARWHLRQPLSDLLSAYWSYQNNVFISFSLSNISQKQQHIIQCITELGIWAPLSKTIWYLSTTVSSKKVFQSLLNVLDPGDQLCVFDSHGQLALWQDDVSIPFTTDLANCPS